MREVEVASNNNPHNSVESAEELFATSVEILPDELDCIAELDKEIYLYSIRKSLLESSFSNSPFCDYDLNFVDVALKRNSTVDVSLKVGGGLDGRVVPVRALVDSGAAGNLISREFVDKNRIPLKEKLKPVTVVLANREKTLDLNF